MTAMEQDFWNEVNLAVPPLLSYTVSRKKFNVQEFKKLLESSIQYFSDMSELDSEIKQVSQFLYLTYNPMRRMKGYQEMGKTHQVAERIRRLDIVNTLEAFNSYVSDDFQPDIRLPHRQNLDYILIRLQGLAKLSVRLVEVSRKSAKYMLGLIKAGSFYIKGTIYSSSLAKIWNIGRDICKCTVKFYNSLRVYREKLKERKSLEWMADNCQLPENLSVWLGEVYDHLVVSETCDFKMLTKEEDVNNFLKNRINSSQILHRIDHTQGSSIIITESVDNLVEFKEEARNEIEEYTPISRKSKEEEDTSDYVHSLKSLTTKDKIKVFIKFEDRYRKTDESKSITIKKMNKKIWKEMKKDLSNKLLLMQENTLVEYIVDYLNDYLTK